MTDAPRASSSNGPERLAAALEERYRIEVDSDGRFRLLGQGGMAIVYLARDLKHRRSVAVKVLKPELAAVLGADRFLQEIEIAAGLRHPHIVPVYDSGEAAGQLYYVMPYVEGESLRDRLRREPQLTLDDALQIAREVADALGYAHGRGVIHRDIKPENILLSGGHAVVADFGIARALSTAGGGSLTETGLALGTPAYMSPEQACGNQVVDARSDLYSLACVLYEMLVGHPPFTGRTFQELLARHSLDPVPPLRTIRPELPPAVERAVLKALAKAPADRFLTTSRFMQALAAAGTAAPTVRWPNRLPYVVTAGVVALAAAAVLFFGPSRTGVNPSSGDTARTVAVLAFTNIGGDSTTEPFSDGMADELTTALGKVEGLIVTARASAFSFKRKGLSPQEIGTRLHVRYIVDGTVRRAENRRRVRAQLIDVATEEGSGAAG